ncbi:hypothetical protein G5C51_40955 [Streptomyces sp. A7024]|uniref:Uncharacterized protein n=1 Tax=Streptomyces coryli TaxID=1128680 RepID=A0A6G4UDE8_9ACTN|nr:hypothetical protein [Streptomyces coryli]NGN70239.1 hypothetical protein [Streptomyces coryli]
MAIAGSTSTANAASAASLLDAKVAGAYGVANFTFASKTSVNPLDLKLTDTSEDGQHAQMRVIAGTGEGTKYYQWRKAYNAGNTNRWDTYLGDSSGVKWIRLQVCRYNGSTQKACAYSSISYSNWW